MFELLTGLSLYNLLNICRDHRNYHGMVALSSQRKVKELVSELTSEHAEHPLNDVKIITQRQAYCLIRFINGSEICITTFTDQSRGRRFHGILYDDALPGDILPIIHCHLVEYEPSIKKNNEVRKCSGKITNARIFIDGSPLPGVWNEETEDQPDDQTDRHEALDDFLNEFKITP